MGEKEKALKTVSVKNPGTYYSCYDYDFSK
jgi:hypothetical protein